MGPGRIVQKLKKALMPAKGKRLNPRAIATLVGILILIVGICAGVWYLFAGTTYDLAIPNNPPEVAELNAGAPKSFPEYSAYFKELAQKKGAVYAYAVAMKAQFPQGIDLHLLGHVIGDQLYKQQGMKGIKYCTQDFRNACSHSIVVGVLTEKGEGALPEIAEACKEAPGGKGAYTMCYHGLGHGILAYVGYDLQKAVAMCKKVGTSEFNGRENTECVGGTIMEMISGVNDRAAWEKQVGNYFKKEDPLYPCDASWMGADVKGVCYTYLTPHLFTSAGGDLNNLNPAVYPKAFSFCDALPTDDLASRGACFGGFGKEFIVSVQGRDIRDIGSTQAPALKTVRDWCAEAKNAFGENACNATALASLFWGGENNPDASFSFCAIATGEAKDGCYKQMVDMISYYGTPQTVASLCARLPSLYAAHCGTRPAR